MNKTDFQPGLSFAAHVLLASQPQPRRVSVWVIAQTFLEECQPMTQKNADTSACVAGNPRGLCGFLVGMQERVVVPDESIHVPTVQKKQSKQGLPGRETTKPPILSGIAASTAHHRDRWREEDHALRNAPTATGGRLVGVTLCGVILASRFLPNKTWKAVLL